MGRHSLVGAALIPGRKGSGWRSTEIKVEGGWEGGVREEGSWLEELSVSVS